MQVHQAIYGDLDGAYALLGTSFPDNDRARRICNITDLIDRPNSGELTEPIIRGFTFEDFYLFIKSFPDTTSRKIRKGRIFSHTIIVESEQLHNLSNLQQILSIFPPEIDKSTQLRPINIDEEQPNDVINTNSREAAMINCLLNEEIEQTSVWVGEEGYFSFLSKLWSGLNGKLRSTIRFGIAFDPNIVLASENINILYIKKEYKTRWSTSSFCIVNENDREPLKSLSSLLLANQKEESQDLIDFINHFNIKPLKIQDISYSEDNLRFYQYLSKKKINYAIALCHFISEFSQPSSAIKEKNHLLSQIAQIITSATADELLMLDNITWEGFTQTDELLGTAITKRLNAIFSKSNQTPVIGLITKAVSKKVNNDWWKKAVKKAVGSYLNSWDTNHATTLLGWLSEDTALLKLLEKSIPRNNEQELDFITAWKHKGSSKVLGKLLNNFAINRKWLTLYGLTSLSFDTPENSIAHQLENDTDPAHFTALEEMGRKIKDQAFIDITLNIDDSRLITIAGQKITSNPTLLNGINVKNSTWRELWLVAIDNGSKPWAYINKPTKVLYTLFEEMLTGSSIDPDLLQKLSSTTHNDLSEFKQREKVWSHLTGEAKKGFLKATTLGCIKLLDKNKVSFSNLEDEVINTLGKEAVMQQIIDNTDLTNSTKIQLFEKVSTLQERSLIKLLRAKTFTSKEATRIGKLILTKKWRSSANYISKEASSRRDLEPAMKECKSLIKMKGWLEEVIFPFFHSSEFSDDISIAVTNNNFSSIKANQKKKARNILFLSTSPKDKQPLRLDEEFREIEECIKIGDNDYKFKIINKGAVRSKDLRRTLLDHQPYLVHFSGHGDTDGISLEDDNGNSKTIKGSALANLFKLEESISCIILNACFSATQAKEIVKHIPYVIGMKIKIGDDAAIQFSMGFYDALARGKKIPKAFEYGISAIEIEGLDEEHIPVLIQHRSVGNLTANDSQEKL